MAAIEHSYDLKSVIASGHYYATYNDYDIATVYEPQHCSCWHKVSNRRTRSQRVPHHSSRHHLQLYTYGSSVPILTTCTHFAMI